MRPNVDPLANSPSVQALGTYFTIYYGEVQFRRYQMGQGYMTLVIVLGLFLDYGTAQTLQANNSTTIREEILRFLLSSFSLSLFLCTCYAHYHHHPYGSHNGERHSDTRAVSLLGQQYRLEQGGLIGEDDESLESQSRPDEGNRFSVATNPSPEARGHL